MKPIISAKGVTAGYQDGFSLAAIDLSVREGEVLCIVGPNGSGKTTLVRTLSRVIKPQKGEVCFEGTNIWDISPKEFSQRVAVVSQNSVAKKMTVMDYVLLGRTPYYSGFQLFERRRDLEEAIRAMRLTGISSLRERRLDRISGGECQMASIARALAQTPKLLILDEPVAHLDLSRQVEILRLIGKRNSHLGITVVMVMHEVNMAVECCTRIAVMKRGAIVAIGTPEEVLDENMVKDLYGDHLSLQTNPFSKRPMLVIKSPIAPQKDP